MVSNLAFQFLQILLIIFAINTIQIILLNLNRLFFCAWFLFGSIGIACLVKQISEYAFDKIDSLDSSGYFCRHFDF